MLSKLFGSRTIKLSFLRKPAPAATAAPLPPAPPEERPGPTTPLRIVHAGGFVERYYMAVPAGGIMKKHPRAVLARPDVFRRPWNSLVRPEEILIPGEKFYVVPRRTIQKLRRRIRRPAVHEHSDSSERERESESESDVSSKSLTARPGPFKVLGLTVAGLERKKVDKNVAGRRAAADPRVQPRKWRVRMAETWQPSLEAIDEASK